MTQADLARCVACSLAMIRKIEQDERRPSKQITLRLAQCLNVPTDEQPILMKVARRERSVEKLTSLAPSVMPAVERVTAPVGGRIHALPAQTTPFIGRAEELAEIARLLGDPGCRLLTLLGLGGTGKTRLALEAAGAEVENFPHGVVYVSLSALNYSEFVVPPIAESLGLSFHREQDPTRQLLSYLQPRQLLIILDGIEYPPAVAKLVTKILSTTQHVKVLATSQARLNLREEWLFEVRGMSLDKSKISGLVEDSDAVTLFVQSARRVRPDFSLSADNWASVIRICELVDGMPLGIELASAWVRTLSCQDIVAELEKGLALLADSVIETVMSQGPGQALFDRSWNLLSEPQRDVLGKLSVFQGAFQREAAVQVAGATLDTLAELVDRSLLHIDTFGHHELDELLRRYANKRLGESRLEAERVWGSHSQYFGQWLHSKEEALTGPQQAQALWEIADAIADIRLGWQWAVNHEEWAILESYLDSLFTFYEIRGVWAEGVDNFATLVESMTGSKTSQHEKVRLYGRVLSRLGLLAAHLGRYDLASDALRQSLAVLINVDAAEVAFASGSLGYLAYLQGHYDEAKQRVEDSLAICTALEDKWGIASSFTLQGAIVHACGEDDRASQLYRESLAICKEIGNRRGIALALNHLGEYARSMGDHQEAQRLLQQSQQIFIELGDKSGRAMVLKNLADVAHRRGQFAESKRLLSESLAISRAIGYRQGMIHCLDDLGNLACAMREYHEAIVCFREALRIAISLGTINLTLDILIDLATALSGQRKADETLRLLGLVLAHLECQQGTREKGQRLLSDLEAELSAGAIVDGLARGQMLELEMVVSGLLDPTQ